MNYQKLYDTLILRSKNRVPPTDYTEKHHIIPRCMGGTDDTSNLTPLLLREHFLAHLLLSKIYPNNLGLLLAIIMMSRRREYLMNMYL